MKPEVIAKIAEIKARLAKTRGPWKTGPMFGAMVVAPLMDRTKTGVVCECPEGPFAAEDANANADFIAHARQDIPELLAIIEGAWSKPEDHPDDSRLVYAEITEGVLEIAFWSTSAQCWCGDDGCEIDTPLQWTELPKPPGFVSKADKEEGDSSGITAPPKGMEELHSYLTSHAPQLSVEPHAMGFENIDYKDKP